MILVTGGTGLVGSHLLYHLLIKGHQVRAIHRASSNLNTVKKVFGYYGTDGQAYFDQIEWMECNITDIPKLHDAFEGITQVYHAAAYISFDPKNYYKLKKSNVEGTANMVNLALSHGITKFCYVSSIATLGTKVDGSLITEETDWNPEESNSVYAITKYGAEMEVWRASQEGLSVVVVNPGVILGAGFWNSGSGSIVKSIAKGQKYYTSGGVGWVDVLDVVRAMYQLMHSEVTNRRFILVGYNSSFKELIGQWSQVFGTQPPSRHVPKWILQLLRRLDGFSSFCFGTKRKLLKSTVNSMYQTSFYDGMAISQALDFAYTPMEETQRRIAERYSMESP